MQRIHFDADPSAEAQRQDPDYGVQPETPKRPDAKHHHKEIIKHTLLCKGSFSKILVSEKSGLLF